MKYNRGMAHRKSEYVLMDRRGRFYNRGRWVRTLAQAAKYDEQIAGDLFRNMPGVKEYASVADVRRWKITAAPKRTRKYRHKRRAARRRRA